MKTIALSALAIFSYAIACKSSPNMTAYKITAHPEYNTAHHDGNGFKNPWPAPENPPGSLDAIGWILSHQFKSRKDELLPGKELTLAEIRKKNRSAFWVGHSTAIFQLGGKTLLTDPVFSDRASPFSFAGPKRMTKLPIEIQNLGKIDIVIISHNHYDHMDNESIAEIAKRFDPVFVVPLGNTDVMRSWGAKKIVEMDWWQYAEIEGLKIHCLPARHFSNRGLTDRNEMLWASYLVEDNGWKMYYAGDTGYADHFRLIGDKFGPIDLAMLPIGAYTPRWFMQEVHIDPDEALQAFIDLDAKKFFGVHWGTFILADEPLQAPKERVLEGAKSRGISEDKFLWPAIGGSLGLD